MYRNFSLFLLAGFLFLFQDSQAKIWRVNNTPGVNADFNQVNTAIADSRVTNDDTLYIEGSATSYNYFTLSKRLVIIGNGYFLSGSGGNSGLQYNTLSTNVNTIIYDSAASGSQIIGLEGFDLRNSNNGSGTDNIIISRCSFRGFGLNYTPAPNTTMEGWEIRQSYINGTISLNDFVLKNWTFRNNIVMNSVQMGNVENKGHIIRNNVFRSTVSIYEAYFANNIINNSTFTAVNCVIKNNLAIGTPAGFTPFVGNNNNSNGYTDAAMFAGATGNSTDGQWQLAAGSPAKGAGLTIGSVTSPDCGAFGATDPYRLSGIPNIPTIYQLTVPATVPSGSNTMSVTFSSKNNN